MTSSRINGSSNEFVTISFSGTQRKKMKIVEITQELLSALQTGENLFIKGSERDEAVLCSQSHTFGMKRVETSNSVFLTSSSKSDKYTIIGRCIDYYEIKPVNGKVDNLRSIVDELRDNGREVITKQKLLSLIAASESELEKAFRKHGIVETAAGLRVLQYPEIVHATRLLFNGIISNGLMLNCLSEDCCLSFYDAEDGEVMKFVLSTMGSKVQAGFWNLNYGLVGRAAVRVVFGATKVMSKENFRDEWLMITPGVTSFHEDVLLGLVIHSVDTTQTPSKHQYHYLPVDELCCDPNKRLERLFMIKPRYDISELTPYFLDLVGGPGQPKTVEEILLGRSRLIDGKYAKK